MSPYHYLGATLRVGLSAPMPYSGSLLPAHCQSPWQPAAFPLQSLAPKVNWKFFVDTRRQKLRAQLKLS